MGGAKGLLWLTVQEYSPLWWGNQDRRHSDQLLTSHPQPGSREQQYTAAGFLLFSLGSQAENGASVVFGSCCLY